MTMKRIAVLFALVPFLLGACTSTQVHSDFESDELIAVQHNQNTDCTLLTYRDPLGQTRHVFRKHGVFELGLTYTLAGEIVLKERGRNERRIEAIEANLVTQRINSLLEVKKKKAEHLSSI